MSYKIAIVLSLLSACTLFGPDHQQGVRVAKHEVIKSVQSDDDRASLQPGAPHEGPGSQNYGALFRLSQGKDPEALHQALKLAKSAQVAERSAAATALGAYDQSEVLDPLQSLLKDPSSVVRRAAARALGGRSDPARVEVVSKLSSTMASSAEKNELLALLAKSSPRPIEKTAAIRELLTQVRTHGPDSEQAQILLLRNAPREAEVIAYLHQVVRARKPENQVSAALRQLAMVRDPDLKLELGALCADKSPLIRQAAYTALFLSCPDDRWAILKRAVQEEKDPMALNMIALSVSRAPGPEAAAILSSLEKKSESSGQGRLRIPYSAQAVEEWKKGPTRDPCVR